ncbi:MAG: type II secretion system F family protein, partial [Verrucomicrobia bacterium]|nr:type II secretion system F family protein [Verrucomicrobiota bacterium]
MNLEELAFLNQQLAGMLKSGIPLEGALKQLCENLRRGRMRSELVRLESELSKGVPLQKAVESGEFPEVYKTLIKIGAGTDRLPEILIHVADYYHRAAILWRRLKGLLVYPLIVFAGAIALSLLMLFMYLNVIMPMLRQI